MQSDFNVLVRYDVPELSKVDFIVQQLVRGQHFTRGKFEPHRVRILNTRGIGLFVFGLLFVRAL